MVDYTKDSPNRDKVILLYREGDGKKNFGLAKEFKCEDENAEYEADWQGTRAWKSIWRTTTDPKESSDDIDEELEELMMEEDLS